MGIKIDEQRSFPYDPPAVSNRLAPSRLSFGRFLRLSLHEGREGDKGAKRSKGEAMSEWES